MKLCECGCGQPVTKESNRFIHNHHIRVNNPMRNPEYVEKVRLAMLDREFSEETRSRMSKAKKGKTHVEIFGYEEAERRKKYMSEIMMGHIVTEQSKEARRQKQLHEKGSGWKGGIDSGTWHKHAWKKFGKNSCELCGLSNDEHKEKYNRRLEMHNTLDPKDYSVMEPNAWLTLCASCHAKVEKN